MLIMSEVRTSLVIDEQPAVDELWAERLRDLSGAYEAVYEDLTPDKATVDAEMARFFNNGMSENPNLRPTKVTLGEVQERERSLVSFKEMFRGSSDLPHDVAQLYQWRLNELIGNQRILQAAVAGNDNRFEAYNEFVYGAPDAALFGATTDWFRDAAITTLDDSPNQEAGAAAEKVLRLIPDLGGDRNILLPSEETFGRVRDQHWAAGGHYALLFAGVELPEKGPIKPEVGDPILGTVRHNLHADQYEIVDASGTVWSVSHDPAQLRRPAAYSMPKARFVGLGPGHEWTHVLESINGWRQPVRLAGSGFDRFERTNEGRAVVREQVAFPTIDAYGKQLRHQDIMRRFHAIGHAEGLSGGRADFVGTFAILNAVDQLWETRKLKPGYSHEETQATLAKSNKRTGDLLSGRIFRGTEGLHPYRKDMVYLMGNVAVWNALEADPSVIDLGDLGKFDITNERHVAVLRKYGALPAAA